ncbi:unnamed protein product, partial [Nesidiocoris tenuis]
MRFSKVIFQFINSCVNSTNVLIFIFLTVILHLSVISEAKNVDVSTAVSATTTESENSNDTVAEESSVRLRTVGNNNLRYGAIYRGNSTSVRRDRASRIFTKRPKISRKDRHRHSTKVDTTKLPVVLLPPLLTFKRNENNEVGNREAFVINVVTPESSLTTAPSHDVTYASSSSQPDQTPVSPSGNQPQYTSTTSKTQKPYVDHKIMAMKNFGIRMRNDATRGFVRFQSTTTSALTSEGSTTTPLSDYTPPPTQFPTAEHRLRQIGKQNPRRRQKFKSTTTTSPTPSTQAAEQFSTTNDNNVDRFQNNESYQPLEIVTPSAELKQSYEPNYSEVNNLSYAPQDSTSPTAIDFRNSSYNDVINYDIQKTSALTGSAPVSTVSQNYRQDAQTSSSQTVNPNFDPQTPPALNEQQRFAGQNYVSSENPQNLENTFQTNNAVSVSSPGTPSDYYNNYISSQDPNSFTPRTEINVATSTSQLVKSSPQVSVDYEDFDLRDLFFQPLTILAPPFLEDEFHDSFGNVIPNTTLPDRNQEQHRQAGLQANVQQNHQEYVTTSFPDAFQDSYTDYAGNLISPQENSPSTASPPSPFQNSSQQAIPDNAYSDNVSTNNIIGTSTEPSTQQAMSTNCDAGSCKNDPTFIKPWTKIPPVPSDVKVLSEEEGLDLINKMYENLLRVLEGGTDYYDLQEEPQAIQDNRLQDDRDNEDSTQTNQKQEIRQQENRQQENGQQENAQRNKPYRGNRKHDGQRKSSETNLIAEESGDIRNERERARLLNDIPTPTGRRNSRRK